MTAPVDVMAVIKADARAACERRCDAPGKLAVHAANIALRQSWAAHDAVAKLIAAANRVAMNAAMTAPEDHYHEVNRTEMDAMIAALARVGGGA